MATNVANEQYSTFFDDLVRCETRLYNAVGDRLRAQHGLVTTQLEYLRYFRAHPAARVADAATNFAAGVGAISKGVDRLAGRGWVSRQPNPADGRSALVNLTEAGASLVADADRTYFQALDDLLSPIVASEHIAAAGAVLGALRRSLEARRMGLPVG